MHKEMLMKQRNMMIKLRKDDKEYQKYDLENRNNFDSELIEKKHRAGKERKFQEREGKRDEKQYKKHTRILNKCQLCFFQERFDRDYIISESNYCYLSFPMKTSPLCPPDGKLNSHIILVPKNHFLSCVELDEEVQTDLRNYQKSIVAFYKEHLNMTTVFIETSI